jgi:hypothetical protein
MNKTTIPAAQRANLPVTTRAARRAVRAHTASIPTAVEQAEGTKAPHSGLKHLSEDAKQRAVAATCVSVGV